MRLLSFASWAPLLLCAAGTAGLAQETLPTVGQTLEGTWVSQVAPPGGDYVPFGLGTFTAGGSYLGTTTDATQSTHHGVWLRVGDRKFVLSTMFFVRDDKGVHSGIVKTRIAITLAEDLKSYEAAVERVIMDTSGRELQVITGIRARSVRLNLETQQTPSEPVASSR